MRPPIDPTFEPAFDVIRHPVTLPGMLGEPGAAREVPEASVIPADERNYFSARAEEHGRLAAEAKSPQARAVHLEFAERYFERSLQADGGTLIG